MRRQAGPHAHATARHAPRVFSPLTPPHVRCLCRQPPPRNKQLVAVVRIAQLPERHQRHWVAGVRHASVLIGAEDIIDVGCERGVPGLGLAERRQDRAPAVGAESQRREQRDGAAERVPDDRQLVVRVRVQQRGDGRQDEAERVRAREEEARVDGAVRTRRVGVRKVRLRGDREVGERVDQRVGSAEGDDDAWVWRRRDGDEAAGVGQGEPGVPGLVGSVSRIGKELTGRGTLTSSKVGKSLQ